MRIRKQDRQSGASPGQAKTQVRSSGAGLTVHDGYSYPRMGDAEVEAKAAKGAELHQPQEWGPNASQTPVLKMIDATRQMNRAIAGHTLAGDLAAVGVEFEGKLPAVVDAQESALSAVDAQEEAQVKQVRLEQKLADEGLEVPKHTRGKAYYAAMVLLVLGDLTLISIAFQVLGLSDHLVFGVVPFSSALDIGASTSVFALLVLAHFAGKHLRGLTHSVGLWRLDATADDGSAPGISAVHLGLTIGFGLGGLMVLIGIAAVRASYLSEMHVGSEFTPFLLIQLGVFVAAVALSWHHTHPYEEEWDAVSELVGTADTTAEERCKVYTQLVGECRGLAHRYRALLTEAVQHALVIDADARRLIQLYMFEVRTQMGESTHELLFDDARLPEINVAGPDKELLEQLMGPVDEIKLDVPDADAVSRRRKECRERVRALRRRDGDAAQLEADRRLTPAELDDLLAQLAKPGRETPDQQTASTNGHAH